MKATVAGSAVLKVSRKHFQNVTGVDVDAVTEGNLTDAQFRGLRLNYPTVNPYSRFQYWLGVRL